MVLSREKVDHGELARMMFNKDGRRNGFDDKSQRSSEREE